MGWIGASAATVAVADRFDWFADVVSRTLMPSVFSPQDAGGFYAEGAVLDLGTAAQVSRFSYSPLRSRRTPSLIRAGDPEQYQLGVVTSGSVWFAQGGAEAEVRAGELVLWDTSRPYESGSGTDGRNVEVFVLQIPKAAMPLPSQRVDRLLARRIRGGSGLAAVLSDFVVSLAGNGPDCRPQELDGLGSMAVELAATCLTQQLGDERGAPPEARAQALRRRVDAFIDHHLADPELSPRQIAAHHHISLRQLYVLFEEQQEGVAASIRRRRLERCADELAAPELRGEPVHAIAARWGFAGAPAFSRTFRAAYGTTPSEYRAAAALREELPGADASGGGVGP